ncbi:MAG: hypothetical protein M3R69_17695 [Acidobacteriota bacterium]|nr:hypothetical protein [Acidobacteriota bacterium]
MKLFWMIVAGVCIITAAVFMLLRDFNTAFVIAALGMVAWFLNYRAQMKEIVTAADLEQSNSHNEQNGEDSDED